jgi:tRNA (guanine37-N1)-methyltransferase
MIVIDAVVRLLPGVLGAQDGSADESFSSDADGMLEHPQYTRPREFRGMEVPPLLLSGDHAAIGRWRREQREERTRLRRPDLWKKKTDRSDGLVDGLVDKARTETE